MLGYLSDISIHQKKRNPSLYIWRPFLVQYFYVSGWMDMKNDYVIISVIEYNKKKVDIKSSAHSGN
jgi:hypothetical protein